MVALPYRFAKEYGVLILKGPNQASAIYCRDSCSLSTLLELERLGLADLPVHTLNHADFDAALIKAYEADGANSSSSLAIMAGLEGSHDLNDLLAELPSSEDLLDSSDDAPIIKLLNAILSEAIKRKASDIHVETFEDRVSIRFRIDGVLHDMLQPPRVMAPLLISRLKVMAKLDIAEKRLPQDGRISLRIAGRAVDVRVSTLPTHYGERVVLRLLDKQNVPLDLGRLGLSETNLTRLRRLIQQPHGIILVTGPTGSGKTTSLYAALSELNHVSRNILTVEDPIEYYLAGIGQTQVNTKVDMSFARGLRSILRQDPDVVMVGEIRDLETAQMAVQASLTGHLVLSTLHTNTAIGAVTRLRDMGIEPFLLASSLIGVVAQRLVRVLCPSCKEATTQVMGGKQETVYRAVGCEQCHHSGYQGRQGVYEVLSVDESLRAMIHGLKSEREMEAYVRHDTPSMRAEGWRLVQAGITSVEEVLRVSTELGE